MKNLPTHGLRGHSGCMRSQRYYGYGDPSFEKTDRHCGHWCSRTLCPFFGVIMPPGQLLKNIHQTPILTPINNKQSAIPAQNVLFEYSFNATQANREYTGNLSLSEWSCRKCRRISGRFRELRRLHLDRPKSRLRLQSGKRRKLDYLALE